MASGRIVAVIGASGFIGRGVVRSLSEAEGVSVRLFSRSGRLAGGSPVAPLPDDPAAFAGVDAVIHLAAVAHTKVDEPTYQAVNVGLARRMAGLAAQAEVPRFVFASSIGVHGRWSEVPLGPESPARPVTAYGWSKANAEQRLAEDLAATATELNIVRPPVVYGPGAPANFGQLMKAAAAGIRLPLGQATAPRSIISLANVSDAFAFLALRPGGTQSPTVLIPADDEDLPVRDIYRRLCLLAQRDVFPVSVPRRFMETLMTMAGRRDTYESLFRPSMVDRGHWKAIGWRPPESTESGLEQAIRPLIQVRRDRPIERHHSSPGATD